jgi:hypothetical protein
MDTYAPVFQSFAPILVSFEPLTGYCHRRPKVVVGKIVIVTWHWKGAVGTEGKGRTGGRKRAIQ